MADYGYSIVATLVTDLDPNAFVKASMNDIIGKHNSCYCVYIELFMYGILFDLIFLTRHSLQPKRGFVKQQVRKQMRRRFCW
jgi:hypothetical protein